MAQSVRWRPARPASGRERTRTERGASDRSGARAEHSTDTIGGAVRSRHLLGRYSVLGAVGHPSHAREIVGMLIVGIVLLLLSIIVERVATIRTARLVNAAGGDWESRDFRYTREGGAAKWLSAVALLGYAGMLAGVALIVVALT